MVNPIQRLKLTLMTEGLGISPAARRQLSGPPDHERPLTLADYASTSGIALELEAGVWVNAPITDFNPNFVTAPGAILDYDGERFEVRSSDLTVGATPIPVPSYHDEADETGALYTSYAITHTDRVRISPVEGCAIVCQFCDLPYEFKYRKKPVDGLVGSVARALADPVLQAHHVLISGGTPRAEDFDYMHEVYSRVAGAFPGVDVDVMMAPMPGLLDPVELRAVGIHGLSINLEMYSEEGARNVMYGKWRLGRQVFLDFIARAVEVFGIGRIRSLLMVGLEPIEDTLRGVEALATRGCDPVLSPFRPDPATPLRGLAPPGIDTLIEVFERASEIVARHGVKLGPRCIPCMHNTLTFPDGSSEYYSTVPPSRS